MVAPRTAAGIAQGWCKQPTGVFVQTLKDGVCEDKEEVVVAKEYPRPTLEQLNQLGEMGELVYTQLNKPGYPEVVAVNTGSGVLPWWLIVEIVDTLLPERVYRINSRVVKKPVSKFFPKSQNTEVLDNE